MARCDHGTTFLFQVSDREVKNGRRAYPYVDHIAARGQETLNQEALVILGVQTTVSTDSDFGLVFALQVGAKRLANHNDILVSQVLVHNASNVIFPEDLEIHDASKFVAANGYSFSVTSGSVSNSPFLPNLKES
jgi:hypothetical protein